MTLRLTLIYEIAFCVYYDKLDLTVTTVKLLARTLEGLRKTVLAKEVFKLPGLNYVQTSVNGQVKGFDTSMVFEPLQLKPSKFS